MQDLRLKRRCDANLSFKTGASKQYVKQMLEKDEGCTGLYHVNDFSVIYSQDLHNNENNPQEAKLGLRALSLQKNVMI